jgi:hypothetical protein
VQQKLIVQNLAAVERRQQIDQERRRAQAERKADDERKLKEAEQRKKEYEKEQNERRKREIEVRKKAAIKDKEDREKRERAEAEQAAKVAAAQVCQMPTIGSDARPRPITTGGAQGEASNIGKQRLTLTCIGAGGARTEAQDGSSQCSSVGQIDFRPAARRFETCRLGFVRPGCCTKDEGACTTHQARRSARFSLGWAHGGWQDGSDHL